MIHVVGEERADSSPVSRTMQRIGERARDFTEYFEGLGAALAEAGPDVSDFSAGDPHDPPLEGYGDALRSVSRSQDPRRYAYTMNDPDAQAAAAAGLNERLGTAFRPDDVLLTNAAIAGLAVTLRAVCDEGDEVILISPPHFLYEPMVLAAGAAAVRVPVREDDLDLDVDGIASAISPRTRAIIVNSPHNPTGRIFPASTLRRLGEALAEGSRRNGRTIYLLSDEAYQRILFDENRFESPTSFYASSFLIYTYGKTLLAPGQRLGYVALAPGIPDRDELVGAITSAQLVNGWAWPNSLLQHAMADLEALSVDVPHLQRRRDRMVAALREMGYELGVPEATFYLLVRSPIPDDRAFTGLLARRRVFVMPGTLLEAPGTFRISLTATDRMIDRALPEFAAAMAEAGERVGAAGGGPA